MMTKRKKWSDLDLEAKIKCTPQRKSWLRLCLSK